MRNALIATAVVMTNCSWRFSPAPGLRSKVNQCRRHQRQAMPPLASPDFGSNSGPEQRLPHGRKDGRA